MIRALLESKAKGDNNFNIIAVTRSTKSFSVQSLASNPSISVIEGDLDYPAAIFEKSGPVWGVYSVQIASPGTDTEEKQGRGLIDAAIINGVSHFVYS